MNQIFIAQSPVPATQSGTGIILYCTGDTGNFVDFIKGCADLCSEPGTKHAGIIGVRCMEGRGRIVAKDAVLCN